jgi:hypothetical protein
MRTFFVIEKTPLDYMMDFEVGFVRTNLARVICPP